MLGGRDDGFACTSAGKIEDTEAAHTPASSLAGVHRATCESLVLCLFGNGSGSGSVCATGPNVSSFNVSALTTVPTLGGRLEKNF